MSSDDTGAVTVVALGCIAVLAILTLWLAATAILIGARVQATTAADAAALAAAPVTFLPFGASGPPEAEAARFARANGAELVECDCPIDRSFAERLVEVRVVVRRAVVPLLGVVSVEGVGRAQFVPARLLEPTWSLP